jgi:hypothetical protein
MKLSLITSLEMKEVIAWKRYKREVMKSTRRSVFLGSGKDFFIKRS